MILSIIIPIYKVEAFLEKCLISCENQNLSKTDYEIVCVNDGSPDNSLQIAENIASQYSNIKVISRPNGGLSAARNTGLENAVGEYIFFVDSDDWIAPNCLSLIAEILNNERPDVLCICAANVLDGSIRRRMNYEGYTTVSGPESMKRYSSSCAPFNIVRKKHLDDNRIRFYEGIYHEDVEYTPRMRYLAKKVCYINDIIYYVYQNPNSITRTLNMKKVYDVVDAVIPSLAKFVESHVEKQYIPFYGDIIASALNTVINLNSPIGQEDKRELNSRIKTINKLSDYLLSASLIKYKIEGIIFKLFPGKVVNIIELMQKIK